MKPDLNPADVDYSVTKLRGHVLLHALTDLQSARVVLGVLKAKYPNLAEVNTVSIEAFEKLSDELFVAYPTIELRFKEGCAGVGVFRPNTVLD